MIYNMSSPWFSHLVLKRDIMNNDTKIVASRDRISNPTAILFSDFLKENLRSRFVLVQSPYFSEEQTNVPKD